MRFLMFNLVVVGALFYLLTGGDVKEAQTLWRSEPVQAAKARTDQVIHMAKDNLKKTIAPESRQVEKAPEEKLATTTSTPASKPEAALTKPAKQDLPPLDGEQEIRQVVAQKAPNGISPGLEPEQIETQIAQVDTPEQMEEVSDLVSNKDRRQARKKELSRMVFDMERLFAEKLTR